MIHLKDKKHNQGFTLLEVVLVLILMGVLATLAGRSAATMDDARKFQKTLRAMELTREKMIGNPAVLQSGHRADFGFWGYNRAMPTNLSDLQVGSLWITPYPAIATTDWWANAYSYNGPAGVGQIVTTQSNGANGAAGGTGFDSDLIFTVDVDRFNDNEVHVYCKDKHGTVLTSQYVVTVEVIQSGATSTCTYQTDGYWKCDTAPIPFSGLAFIRAYPDTAPTDYRPALNGADAQNFLETHAVIYPKDTFSNNRHNMFEVRFPGELP